MSRTPLPNEPPLLDPERALRLAEDARAFLKTDVWWDLDGAELARAVAEDAVLLALEVAVDTGDPRLIAASIDAAEDAARDADATSYYAEIAFSEAAGAILPRATEFTNRVRECARSSSAVIRQATAVALAPRALRSMRGEGDEADAEAMKIVFALAKDEDGRVRQSAREALGGIAPPAWAAFFDRDPLASRSAAEAGRLRAPLDRAAERLDELDSRDAGPLAQAVAELPDDLALPLLEKFVLIGRAHAAPGGEALIARWVRLDTDGSRLIAWLERAKHDYTDRADGERIGRALAARPPAEAVAIATRVAGLIARLSAREHILALMVADGIVATSWPDTADPTPLLELALGAPLAQAAEPDPDSSPYGLDIPRSKLLRSALAPRAAFALVLEPLVDALIAGFPGRWRRVKPNASGRLVELRHPRLRAHAEAAVRGGEGEAAAWGLRHLTEGGHDPARDLAPDAILAAAALDPRLRAAMIEDHTLRARAREPLRARLAEGVLSPHEALVLGRWLVVAAKEQLSPDEQAAVRRAREAAEDVIDRATAVAVLPLNADEWTSDDRAYVERLIEEHGHDARVASNVALVLEQRARPELVPLAEKLLARAPHDMVGDARRCLEICRGDRWNPWMRG